MPPVIIIRLLYCSIREPCQHVLSLSASNTRYTVNRASTRIKQAYQRDQVMSGNV